MEEVVHDIAPQSQIHRGQEEQDRFPEYCEGGLHGRWRVHLSRDCHRDERDGQCACVSDCSRYIKNEFVYISRITMKVRVKVRVGVGVGNKNKNKNKNNEEKSNDNDDLPGGG